MQLSQDGFQSVVNFRNEGEDEPSLAPHIAGECSIESVSAGGTEMSAAAPKAPAVLPPRHSGS